MVCPLKAHKDINYDNQLQKPENQNLDLVPTTTHYFKDYKCKVGNLATG